MNIDLKNQIAVITGASKGIGLSLVEEFSKNNCNIWACARTKTNEFIDYCKKLEVQNNIFVRPIFFDLNDYNEIKFSIDHINKNSEKIDHLINNAGVLNNSLFQMTEIENFKTIFEVNFFSQIYLSQLIIKKMIKQKKGNIINISSTSSQDNDFGRSAYSSSKAALNSISKVMSKELSRFNIKVNVIAPGLVDTNLMRDNTEKKYLDATVSKLNVKRIASPEEISKLALYLASDDSSYISGEIIRIDGGMGS